VTNSPNERPDEHALKLAQDELDTRADVFTMDTLAWALSEGGRRSRPGAHQPTIELASTV
jgi:hypothetical protein